MVLFAVRGLVPHSSKGASSMHTPGDFPGRVFIREQVHHLGLLCGSWAVGPRWADTRSGLQFPPKK